MSRAARAFTLPKLHPGAGTMDDPMQIDAFPFMDARNTAEAQSDVIDYYSAAPNLDERGSEYIHVLNVAAGGTLTAWIS